MNTETIRYESGIPLKSGPPWQITAFAVFLVAVVFIAAGVNKRKKRAFEALTSFMQGKAGGSSFFQNYNFRGVYKNRPLFIKHVPQGKNTPAWLIITFEDPLFALDLKISMENIFKRTMEKIGVMKDIKTGEPDFDARFQAVSDTVELACKYLSGPVVRSQIAALFDSGAHSLELLPHGVTIPGAIKLSKRNPDLEPDLAIENLLPVLDALDVLCSEKNGKEFFGELRGPGPSGPGS